MSATAVSRAVRGLSVAVLLFGPVACGPSDSNQSTESSRVVPGSQQDLAAPARLGAQFDLARAPDSGQQKRIAFTHSYTLRLPSRDVERVQQAHIDACVKVGCEVLNTRVDRLNDGRITAQTSVRVAPDKLADFTAAMTAPPVEVISHAQTAEDKTQPLLDVEKRLEVKVALRDRLNALLHDNTQKTAADLVAIERELAQVQGEIESFTSQRDYLLTLTDTVRINIFYSGVTAQVGGFDLSPVKFAVNGIGRTVVSSVASLISFAAAALPWIPVALLAAWIARVAFLRWRRRPARA